MAMDPRDPSSFNHRTELLSTGKKYHFVLQKPRNFDIHTTNTILCLHGFPDCWFGWRNQIKTWVENGYQVLVPDMLGYGGTDKPANYKKYSPKNICEDLSALLELLSIDKAIICGHDWGAAITWRFALWYPLKTIAVIALSVPFHPPAPIYLSPEETAKRVPDFGYQVYFDENSSTKEIEGELPFFVRLMFQRPGSKPPVFTRLGELRKMISLPHEVIDILDQPLLSDKVIKYYTEQLSNMNGPLSYYRNNRTRYEEERAADLPSTLPPQIPVLMFWGSEDKTTSTPHVQRSRKFIPHMRSYQLDGKGHWLMIEAPESITYGVLTWLDASLSPSTRHSSKL